MPDLRPLYPYAGGKRKYIEDIGRFIQHATYYVEPFFGGGAVFCFAVNLQRAKRFIINDVREEIIDIYRAIKNDSQPIAREFGELKTKYEALSIGGKEQMYYAVKDYWLKTRSAAHKLIILNTLYGAMYQVDTDGVFDTASGHMRFIRGRTIGLDPEQIMLWGEVLQNTDINSGDYSEVNIPTDSLVFCDPPYLDVGFGYDMPFTTDDQLRCFNWCCDTANRSDVSVIMTNNDSRDYFTNLCSGKRVRTIRYSATYSAGVNTNSEEIAMIWNERKSSLIL